MKAMNPIRARERRIRRLEALCRAWRAYAKQHGRTHPHAALLAGKIADCFDQAIYAPNPVVRDKSRGQGYALQGEAQRRFGLKLKEVR